MNPGKIAELRKERGRGLISAVGEYTPDELWQALDCIEALRAERDALHKALSVLLGWAEAAWIQIDGEWGPCGETLDQQCAGGDEPEIAAARAALKGEPK